mmetsp:Transcript_9241/g.19948  ORF Transcript_9241/g.19948 Transcript_9241/m.19948 type:complete len:679 (+) Transcript_9241:64-2100(+)
MAKTKSNRRRGGAKQTGNWSNAEHDARTAKRIASLNKKKRRRHQEHDAEQAQQEESAAPPPSKRQDNDEAKRPRHHEPPRHQVRVTKKSHGRNNHHRLASQVPDDAYKRSHLAHDNYDQIDSSKLRLATVQILRKIDALKERLESWDPVEEAQLKNQSTTQSEDVTSIEYKMKIDAQNRLADRTARQKAHSDYNLLHAAHGVNSSQHRRKANLKKKPRPGPESWKLRGAARPAWEVYDFDTRYVDVHVTAKEEANARARRAKNVFVVCRGRFALEEEEEDDDGNCVDNTNAQNGKDNTQQMFPPPQPQCREYLSLLTQLGSLQLHRKNYSSARKSFLEVIDLEGSQHSNSITNARNQLMNMYLSTNRPSSARKLWTTLQNDGSAWIRYAAALIEYVSWNLLHEEGSTRESAEKMLTQAIRGNVYVAYLLAWPHTFERAMEYTSEVVEGGMCDKKSGSMLEAIEYGCCCYEQEDSGDGEEEDRGMGMWMGTDGSLDWVRSVVLRVLNTNEGGGDLEEGREDGLTRADLLSWETKLNKEEEEYEKERAEKEQLRQERDAGDESDDGNRGEEEEEEDLDVVMYAGMFRTAMDWLQDAGEFLKEPSYDYINVEEDAAEDAMQDEDADQEDVKEDNDKNNEDDNNSNVADGDSGDSDGDGSLGAEDGNDGAASSSDSGSSDSE